MGKKAEKALQILDICAFCVAVASTIAIAYGFKRNKKITKLDAINLFTNGWIIGEHASK